MTDREAMRMALEAMQKWAWPLNSQELEAIAALRQALEQPEQEPVALESVYEIIIHWDEGGGKRSRRELARRITELYTAPPEARQDKA